MLCPDCGATSTLSTRCTNCGRPAAGPGADPCRPGGGADDRADDHRGDRPDDRPDDRDEAAWSFAEDRGDDSWRSTADTVGRLESAKAARAAWDTTAPTPAAQGWQLWQLKSVGGLAIALYALLAASMAVSVAVAVASFRRASLVGDLRDADPFDVDPFSGELGGVSPDDLASADDFVLVASGLDMIVFIATAVVFVVWFFRARKNVEMFGLHRPRLGCGWAIGGWICPVVNMWFPARIASDLWKGSDTSKGAADIGNPLGRVTLIASWWVAFSVATVINRVGTARAPDGYSPDDTGTLDDVIASDRLGALTGVLFVIAGVFAILLVRRITALQNERTAQLWAMSGPQAMWGAPPTSGGFPVPAPPRAPLPPGSEPSAQPGQPSQPAPSETSNSQPSQPSQPLESEPQS
ncbi:DUF4328 domain-containing protein [Streptodolium elevatio]